MEEVIKNFSHICDFLSFTLLNALPGVHRGNVAANSTMFSCQHVDQNMISVFNMITLTEEPETGWYPVNPLLPSAEP